jgi:Carboxypeptidase regulatory-like domain
MTLRRIGTGLMVKLLYAVLLLAPACCLAQTASTGTVVGTVRDVSGAVVPSAQVEITNSSVNFHREIPVSSEGAYKFVQVPPGTYDIRVTAAGFQATALSVTVNVAESALADVTLAVGGASQTVQVSSSASEVSLQTTNSSVGEVMDHEQIASLPTVQRQITQLVYLQPGTTPLIGGAEGTVGGGSVSGGRVDQNSMTLDGINVTDESEGGYLVNGLIASFPIPVDAVQEFRGTVSNPTEDQNRSGGGQFALTVRRGSNDWHGLAYDYYQNAALNANSWSNNRTAAPRPGLISNRFGGTFGGPFWKDRAYFFLAYEGYRFPNSANVTELGITETMRSGILRFKDAAGNLNSFNFNPANGPLSSGCGPAGNQACDPRGIGLSPIIKQYFNFYPVANSLTAGDGGINTAGIQGPVSIPAHTDFGVARFDYRVNQSWGAFVYFLDSQQHQATTDQIDFNPAVTKGKLLVSTSSLPLYPYVFVTGTTGQLTPNLTYDFRFGFNQQGFNFAREIPQNILPSAGYPIQLAYGVSGVKYLDAPGNDSINTLPKEAATVKEWQFNNSLNWVKASHLITGGFNYIHSNQYHFRLTQGGSIASPVAQITSGSYTQIPATQRPPTCSASLTTHCLPTGVLAEWNELYASLLGQWDYTSFFNSRDAKGNVVNSVTSPPSYDQTSEHFEFMASDTWQVKPSLTLNYGINLTYETPYRDINGKDYLLVDGSNNLVKPAELLSQKLQAANKGTSYNIPISFVHPAQLGGRAIYPASFTLGPRVGIAWNPALNKSFLAPILGKHKTVIRGGLALMHDQILGIQTELYGIIGNQLIATQNLTTAPTCESAGTPGPGCVAGSSPFRVGVDGQVYTGNPTAFSIPYTPHAANAVTGASFGVTGGDGLDPNFHPGKVYGLNFSVQREIPGGALVEVGWIGRFGRELANSANVNAPPITIGDLSGQGAQSFAAAFDALAAQLRSGVTAANVTPQPWFENSIGKGATATIATNNSTAIVQNNVSSVFTAAKGVDALLETAGKPAIDNRQFQTLTFQTNMGWSNYNAGFASFRKRTTKGLSLVFNYTLAKCLDTDGRQSDSLNGHLDNPYNPAYAYGACMTDVRQVGQAYGSYDLPFYSKGGGLVGRALGGWSTAYIVTGSTGSTLEVTQGNTTGYSSGNTDGPTVARTGPIPSLSVHHLSNGSYNLFANATTALANMRYINLSTDTFRSNRGAFYGLGQWNVDFNVQKSTKLTERVSSKFTLDFFNLFNHANLITPTLNYNAQSGFGSITQDQSAWGNNISSGPRRIQASLRVQF